MPESTSSLCLMAVHAHPDDEAIGTGGVLAMAADAGITTVLVTCTDGALGDAPGGIKPGDDGHDEGRVAALRRDELKRSAEILNISHVELLDYSDSGMIGWPQNEAPNAFWNQPVEVASARLIELIEKYRPQVLVTYDDNGFYGHPDHIQANRITAAAWAASAIPQKLYYTAVPRSAFQEMVRRMEEMRAADPDAAVPDFDSDGERDNEQAATEWGTPDEDITTVVEVADVIDRKFGALLAHESQVHENSWFLQMPEEFRKLAFGRESFVLVEDRSGAVLPETDLFNGLR